MKPLFTRSLILLATASCAVAHAEEIHFLKGQVDTVPPNLRTPIRKDEIEFGYLTGNFDRNWRTVETTKDKPFTGAGFNNGYAKFEINSPEEKIMFLEATGNSMVYVNGTPRMGDIYSFGYVSLPVKLNRGKNEFVFATVRGQFYAKLVDVTTPYSFDLRDATTPDIVVGEKGKLLVSVNLRNATEKPVENLTIQAGGVTTKVPRIYGLSNQKVNFEVAPNKDGKYTLNLLQNGKLVDSKPLELRIRTKNQTHKRTFISKVDGSVQYYAVQPSSNDKPGQALVLSLHGASVQAIGQADSYGQKSWAYIVCPTNRRPYGFNWEDIGRLDALEVLEHARNLYKTDPQKTYLTGHSMGGHGTYHVGVLYPDKFAAIAPCAGWISYFSYAGGMTYPNTEVGQNFYKAMAVSDTLKLKRNYYAKPIFIQHGDQDESVPVSEARNMRKALEDHFSVQWNEAKGQGHWFDTDPEPGADCQDYAPIFELFAKNQIPNAKQVINLEFHTPNLNVTNKNHWLTIDGQINRGEMSSVVGKIYPLLRRVDLTTQNVAALTIDATVFEGQGDIEVHLNGATGKKMAVVNNKLSLVLTKDNAWEQDKILTGFKSIFDNRITLVYATGGPQSVTEWSLEKARFDAEQMMVIGNASLEIISDKEYLANKTYHNRNLLLYGDETVNLATKAIAPKNLPFVKSQMDADSIALCAAVDNGRAVGVMFANKPENYKFLNRIPLFTAGASIPDWMVLKYDYLKRGFDETVKAGFNK